MPSDITQENLIDPAVLFSDADHGMCCSCCEGYCPVEDGTDASDGFDMLISIVVSDVEYLGTNKIQIRRDVQQELPPHVAERIVEASQRTTLDWATRPPTQRPKVDTRPQSPSILDRLDRAGITRHHGDDIVHLYLGDQHVGWCMWNKVGTGIEVDDLELVRNVAASCGTTVAVAAIAMKLVREAGR